jgi:hypothetical protein
VLLTSTNAVKGLWPLPPANATTAPAALLLEVTRQELLLRAADRTGTPLSPHLVRAMAVLQTDGTEAGAGDVGPYTAPFLVEEYATDARGRADAALEYPRGEPLPAYVAAFAAADAARNPAAAARHLPFVNAAMLAVHVARGVLALRDAAGLTFPALDATRVVVLRGVDGYVASVVGGSDILGVPKPMHVGHALGGVDAVGADVAALVGLSGALEEASPITRASACLPSTDARLAYVPPEDWALDAGEANLTTRVTEARTIYGLGVILLYMMAPHAVYTRFGPGTQHAAHLRAGRLYVDAVAALGLPERMARVLLWALDPDTEDRASSVEDWLGAAELTLRVEAVDQESEAETEGGGTLCACERLVLGQRTCPWCPTRVP